MIRAVVFSESMDLDGHFWIVSQILSFFEYFRLKLLMATNNSSKWGIASKHILWSHSNSKFTIKALKPVNHSHRRYNQISKKSCKLWSVSFIKSFKLWSKNHANYDQISKKSASLFKTLCNSWAFFNVTFWVIIIFMLFCCFSSVD